MEPSTGLSSIQVMDALSQYLPPSALNTLCDVSISNRSVSSSVLSEDIYWKRQLSEVLNLVIPESDKPPVGKTWKELYNSCVTVTVDKMASEDVMQLWVRNTPNPSSDLLYNAVMLGYPTVLDYLLKTIHGPLDTYSYLLGLKPKQNYYAIVRLLLKDERFDPRHSDSLCILGATDRGEHRVVKLFLRDSRASPQDAYCAAYRRQYGSSGHYKCMKILAADPRVNTM
jgi:hypothetical protein